MVKNNNLVPEKYIQPYERLLADINRLRDAESNEMVDRAFLSLIDSCAHKSSVYDRDIILTVLNSASIAVNEIGLGRTSVISLFIYHSLPEAPDLESIRSQYDDTVALITEGLLKIGQIDETTTSSQAENFRRFLLNLARDVRVILIRLAEQTELMREMREFSPEIQIRLASEANYLYAPLAHRLGLYLIKSEMEDMSLKYTDRSTYDLIAKKLAETMRARKTFIDDFIRPIDESLRKQGFVFDIKGRPKSIHSIWNKMRKKDVDFEDIYDLFAIRIILRSELKNEKADCWQVYSTVTDIYQPNPLRMRDWISIPKSNGYESLHTTVIGPGGKWVEVQIRTERMNEVAEKGVAAHWKYKGLEGEHGIDNWLSRVREILESPETDPGNFIDDFKLSLYSKEIFVFTPKGDLRKFPEGATVLDFAYDIHTDVGSMCTGAKVNGRTVPIRYRMKNGDKIEVLTSKNQNPNLDWLNFVVTSKAQKKIRQKLNEEIAKEAENGKEIVKRRFKNWKIEFSDENIRKLLKKFKYPNSQEFYYQVAHEIIDLAEIKDFLTEGDPFTEPETQQVEELEASRKGRKEDRIEDFLIIDEKIDNIDYKLAKCCSPIMGDSVFGFVTVSEGIKVHRTNCPNAVQLIGKYGYRVVKAKWTRKGPESVFPVNIRVTGEDYSGILKSISEAIAKDLKLNVRTITMDTNDGMISCKISLLVRDLEHLDSLIARVGMLKGIYRVSRVDSN